MKRNEDTKRKPWKAPKLQRLAARLAEMPRTGISTEGVNLNTS